MLETTGGLRSFFREAKLEHDAALACAGEVERELRFADRRLRMSFAGSELAQTVLAAFSARLEDPLADEPPDRTIALWEQCHVPGSPVRVPWSEADIGARGLVRGSDGVVAVHEAGSFALTLADPLADTLLYRVPSSAGLPWWERAAPLRPALFWALSEPGSHLVHAGVIGDEQRGGVLLAGAGGSGKTTVALASLAAGMSYVSDDYVLMQIDPAPVAWNLFGTAKLDAGHLARFPALAGDLSISAGPAADEKAVLDVARILPRQLARSLPIKAIVVPRIRGGKTSLRSATAGEALLALAPSTTLQMPYDNGAVVRSLAVLTRQVPAFALDVGDRVEDLADALDRVLEDLAVVDVAPQREPALRGST